MPKIKGSARNSYEPRKRKPIRGGGAAEDSNETEKENDSSVENENSQRSDGSDEPFEGENTGDVPDFPGNIRPRRFSPECLKPPQDLVRRKNDTPDDSANEKRNVENGNDDDDEKPKSRLTVIIGASIIIFSVFFCRDIDVFKSNKTDVSTRLDGVRDAVKNISLIYPVRNEDVWGYIQTGIERLINQEKEPATFVLVQWLPKNNTAYNIALAAGNVVSKYLGSSGDFYEPIILDPNILNSYDRGDIISLYDEKLKNQHVLIVNNLETVVPTIVQDFRYYCDEDNPGVPKLAIFFIMNADRCENITQSDVFKGSVTDTLVPVETCLTKMWGGKNGLEDDVLQPVLSRFLSMVLPIQET